MAQTSAVPERKEAALPQETCPRERRVLPLLSRASPSSAAVPRAAELPSPRIPSVGKTPQCSTGFSWCGTSTGPNAGNGLYGHRAAGLGDAGHRGTCWAAGDLMLQQRCLCLPVPQRGHWCVPAVPGHPAEPWCSDAAVCGQVSVCVMLVDTKRGRRSSSCSIYMAFVISVAIKRYFRHVGGPEQWRSRTWGCPSAL